MQTIFWEYIGITLSVRPYFWLSAPEPMNWYWWNFTQL